MSAFWHPYFRPSKSSTDMPEPPECKCNVTSTITVRREGFTVENRAERRKRAAMERRRKKEGGT